MDESNNDTKRDVEEWKYREEIAYWKSMAVAYYYENQTLRTHLREVYSDFHNVMKIVDENMEGVEYVIEQRTSGKLRSKSNTKNPVRDSRMFKNIGKSVNEINEPLNLNMKDMEMGKTVKGQEREKPNKIMEEILAPINNRSKELKELYGSKGSQIAGVETVLQLNYEHVCSQSKPKYWPELQLNLG